MNVKLKALILKKHLARRNLSQNSFARRVGVTSGYMSQILCGERNPSPQIRERILQTLNTAQKLLGQSAFAFDDLFKIRGR